MTAEGMVDDPSDKRTLVEDGNARLWFTSISVAVPRREFLSNPTVSFSFTVQLGHMIQSQRNPGRDGVLGGLIPHEPRRTHQAGHQSAIGDHFSSGVCP